MVFIKNIGKVARKVNAVALSGAILIGGMGLMSFVGENTEHVKPIEKAQVATATYGVTNKIGNRLYLTSAAVLPTEECNLEPFPCTVSFDETTVTPVWDPTEGMYYILDTQTLAEHGQGPYPEAR